MTTRSSEEIERDVEATREDLDRTVDALKEKMRPQNLASEAMASIRSSPAGQRAIQMRHQAQDNALPLALIGAGLAWMLANGRRTQPYETRSFRPAQPLPTTGYAGAYDAGPESGYLGADYEPQGPSRTEAMRERAHEMADRTRQRVDEARRRTRDGIDRARHRLSETASDAASRARLAADETRQRAARYGRRAEETFNDTLDREPLIVGALGLAVGAAVGAAMPSTRVENRYVGPLRDRALDEGRTRARQGLQDAKQIANTAIGSVKDEARTQGLTDVDGMVEKAKTVARAGADTVKREVEMRRGPTQ